MSAAIAALVAKAQALEGVGDALDSIIDQPQGYPAVVVERLASEPAEPEEMGADYVELRQVLAVGVHAPFGRERGEAGAARETATAVALALRLAVESDYTLGGACIQARPGKASNHYAKWHGADYAVAEMKVEVWSKEEL